MIEPYVYQLDRKKNNKFPINTLKQGDKRTNIVEVSLFDNGKPIDLYNKNVVVVFLTPNNKIVEQSDLDIDIPIITYDNTVKCIVKDTALQSMGSLKMEIVVSENEDKLFTTPSIRFNVSDKIDDSLPIQEQDDFPTLIALIEEFNNKVVELNELKLELNQALEVFDSETQDKLQGLIDSIDLIESQYPLELNQLREDLDNKSYETWNQLAGGV